MSNGSPLDEGPLGDLAPGDEAATTDIMAGVRGYLLGFILAAALSAVSFYITRSTLVWAPSIPIALSVLAVAQMGVHLVFFLHMTSGPDNVNNLLALAFGLLIVMLLVFGSLWIMDHLGLDFAAARRHVAAQIPVAEKLGIDPGHAGRRIVVVHNGNTRHIAGPPFALGTENLLEKRRVQYKPLRR
jgi:cytochrome o ubiquinol oxidase operon protein cyoD